jgi:hypothetical protein
MDREDNQEINNDQSLLEKILESFPEDKFIVLDGLDNAIIGVYGNLLVYSTKKTIDIFENIHNMTREEAYEYFYFNVNIVMDNYPIFIDDDF